MRGWRWNPEGTPTLYLASSPESCRLELLRLAERAGFREEELPPRSLTRFRVALQHVASLRTDEELAAYGLRDADVRARSIERCQRAAARLVRDGYEGLVAPSAVSEATTLAVYVENLRPASEVEDVRSVRMTQARGPWSA